MKEKSKIRPYLIRLGIVMIISLVGVAVFNEIAYRLQKDDYDRPPQTIRLVIPQGTAALVEQGQDSPVIPNEMIFVIGADGHRQLIP